jgi:hypothetical protein
MGAFSPFLLPTGFAYFAPLAKSVASFSQLFIRELHEYRRYGGVLHARF